MGNPTNIQRRLASTQLARPAFRPAPAVQAPVVKAARTAVGYSGVSSFEPAKTRPVALAAKGSAGVQDRAPAQEASGSSSGFVQSLVDKVKEMVAQLKETAGKPPSTSPSSGAGILICDPDLVHQA